MIVTADRLNSMVEFDCPFSVDEYGRVGAAEAYAPSVYHVEGEAEVEIDGGDWEAFSTGYTGQHGYHGPVMHASELLSGRLAHDVLHTPGVYVVCAVEVMPTDDDPEPEPAGWIVLRERDGS